MTDPLYVFDASALIALETHCATSGVTFTHLVSALTDLNENAQLLCPPLVVKECKTLGATDLITSWVRAAASGFSGASPEWDFIGEAIDLCPDLLNSDDKNESAQIEVVALALQRSHDGHSVTVVTDQWLALPDGTSALGPACRSAGLFATTVPDFILAHQ